MTAPEIAEWAVLEGRCCPFLEIAMTFGRSAPLSIDLSGEPAVKAFLREEFRFA